MIQCSRKKLLAVETLLELELALEEIELDELLTVLDVWVDDDEVDDVFILSAAYPPITRTMIMTKTITIVVDLARPELDREIVCKLLSCNLSRLI